VHEFAHLLTFNDHQHIVKPHGEEWKRNFKRMMNPFFDLQIFPPDIHHIITKYLNNPAASSCSDVSLARALKKYDEQVEHQLTVEELPIHAIFMLKDGRRFKKGYRLRKRYKCLCLDNGKFYLFNPLAKVTLEEI
jgi:SprT protein